MPIAKEINRSLILNLVRNTSGISRVIVAQRTGLSKATVSNIVDALIQEGLVIETGKAQASAGRRPVMLSINRDARLAAGIEIGVGTCRGVLTDLDIHPVRKVSHQLPDTSLETVAAVVNTIALEMMVGYDPSMLIGAGIGIPGIHDDEVDRVTLAENLNWTDVPLRPLLEDRLGIPVLVTNRSNAAAMGEKWYGAGIGVADLVYIRVGSGIGAGFILNTKLYVGVSGSAGEIGHMIVEPSGQACICGSRGCLETVATSGAIASRARQKLLRGRHSLLLDLIGGDLDRVTWLHVVEAAHQDDPVACEVLREAGDYLGIAVANVVTLLNPSMVIIGGPVAEAGDLLLQPIRQRVMDTAFSIATRSVEIITSPLGTDAVAIGAASMFVNEFFAAPVRAMNHSRDGVPATSRLKAREQTPTGIPA